MSLAVAAVGTLIRPTGGGQTITFLRKNHLFKVLVDLLGQVNVNFSTNGAELAPQKVGGNSRTIG